MTALAAQAQGYSLNVGGIDRLSLSVVSSPMQSIHALARATITGCHKGEPARLVRAVRGALRPSARFALAPLAATTDIVPDCAFPVFPETHVSVHEQVERLRNHPPQALVDELAQLYGRALPAHWWPGADDPRRWFHAFADAADDAWSAASYTWRNSAALFGQETNRVGEAVGRGGMDALLNSLHPRITYRDGVLTLATSCTESFVVDRDHTRIALVPMIAGPQCLAVEFSRPGVAAIAYPLPGLADPGRSANHEGVDDEDALAQVLGPLRARTLRAVARPRTAGRLARALHCAANTVTYHCNQLEAAGLIDRERQGPLVWISRTPRGDELVELLSGTSPAS